jgi:hypothetical protein
LNNLWFGDWEKTVQGIGRLAQFEGLPQEQFDERLNNWVMFLDPDDQQLHKLTTLRDTSNNPDLAASIDRAPHPGRSLEGSGGSTASPLEQHPPQQRAAINTADGYRKNVPLPRSP